MYFRGQWVVHLDRSCPCILLCALVFLLELYVHHTVPYNGIKGPVSQIFCIFPFLKPNCFFINHSWIKKIYYLRLHLLVENLRLLLQLVLYAFYMFSSSRKTISRHYKAKSKEVKTVGQEKSVYGNPLKAKTMEGVGKELCESCWIR